MKGIAYLVIEANADKRLTYSTNNTEFLASFCVISPIQQSIDSTLPTTRVMCYNRPLMWKLH